MSKKIRLILTLIIACILVFSIYKIIDNTLDKKRAEQSNKEASELATQEKESASPTTETDVVDFGVLSDINLESLKTVNPDVIGWIRIPDTELDYPLIYSAEKDETYYLSHTWDLQENSCGSIFVEPLNKTDFSDPNTIIYGHNMLDESMFGILDTYVMKNWWEEHKDIYVATKEGTKHYVVFSAYQVATGEITYMIRFSTDEKHQEFIDYCVDQTKVDTGIVPTINENIITLSTCTGNGHATRWVVQAVLQK